MWSVPSHWPSVSAGSSTSRVGAARRGATRRRSALDGGGLVLKDHRLFEGTAGGESLVPWLGGAGWRRLWWRAAAVSGAAGRPPARRACAPP